MNTKLTVVLLALLAITLQSVEGARIKSHMMNAAQQADTCIKPYADYWP